MRAPAAALRHTSSAGRPARREPTAMPRYYCDYCDAHLTHDSNSVRKQHNAGFKHKVRERSARRERSSRPSAPVAANA